MKRLISIPLLALIVITGCENLDIEPEVPKCIVKKTKAFNKQACEDGATVEQYTFQGKTVYVFNIGTCGYDVASQVIDSDCNTIGYLGGYIGNTKINGVEFSTATLIRTVWEK